VPHGRSSRCTAMMAVHSAHSPTDTHARSSAMRACMYVCMCFVYVSPRLSSSTLRHFIHISIHNHAHRLRLGKLHIIYIYQWRSFKLHPSSAKCPGSGTEIIPGKHSDTRIKPLPLTNGHGRYITVTPERTLASVGGCPLNI
jgi:hypothetical protein